MEDFPALHAKYWHVIEMDGLGKRIKKLREQLGMTQGQLAEGICTKSFISQLERGHAQASMRTLHLIANRLGVSAADLLGPDEPVSSVAWVVDALREILDALDAGNTAEARRRTLVALGRMYERTGDKDGALEAYRQAAMSQ